MRRKVIIMGAGGRDFHDFNMLYRDDPACEVVAFTATQIPFIETRTYPPQLAGPLYPAGIPIVPEAGIEDLISGLGADQVVFAYSDVSHEYVMHRASACIARGVDFVLPGPRGTMLESTVPVISVCAVRTGCGKSIVTRKLALLLKARGVGVSVVRHPMAYGGFAAVKRFSSMEDVDREACTIEEREEFEHLVERGITVFAGIDYRTVLDEARQASRVILWDGGNNDFPFVKPDLEIVLLDALRPGHETLFHPGEVNLLRAALLIITKTNEARPQDLAAVRGAASAKNPAAVVLEAPSVLTISDPELLKGRKALVIEDGPTITHGDMPYGAGTAACRGIVASFADPRPFAVGSIGEVYSKYAHVGAVLPAMGYSGTQRKELEQTIAATPHDVVVIATPVDLRRLIHLEKPVVTVSYDFDVDLDPVLDSFLAKHAIR